MVIGLTGPSGSGKSAVAACLREQGVFVIDCDLVAREVVLPQTPGLIALCATFGNEILQEDGSLNRKKLAEIAFSDPKLTQKLNETIHPFILKRIAELMASASAKTVCLDAPTLFQSGLDQKCDRIIGVLAPYQLRLERICARDGLSLSAAKSRLAAQLPDDYFREHCHKLIENHGSLDELRLKTLEVLHGI